MPEELEQIETPETQEPTPPEETPEPITYDEPAEPEPEPQPEPEPEPEESPALDPLEEEAPDPLPTYPATIRGQARLIQLDPLPEPEVLRDEDGDPIIGQDGELTPILPEIIVRTYSLLDADGRELQRGCTAPELPWETTDADLVTAIEASLQPNLERAKARAKEQAAAARYEKEVGGIEFAGVSVDTDRVSQAKLTAALALVNEEPDTIINWKGKDGVFTSLDAEGVRAVALAVAAHVQTCFNEEALAVDLIDACESIEELEALLQP